MNQYIRTPIPTFAKTPSGKIMLCWMIIIFSPFIGFALHGKVEGEALPYILPVAFLGILALITLITRSHSRYNSLPEELRMEYKNGKLFPAMHKPAASEDLLVAIDKKSRKKLRLSHDGIWFTPATALQTSLKLLKKHVNMKLMADIGGFGDVEFEHIPWQDISEWQVRENSENEDYYHLILSEKQYIKLIRPTAPVAESSILDFVRSTGGVPVRIFCDIPLPAVKN